MKKILKYIGIGFGGLFVLLGMAITVAASMDPRSRPASTEKVEATPERIERGRYLANHVGICFACHAELNHESLSQRMVPGTEGFPGGCDPSFPGKVCFSNITSHPTAGIGGWSDGEVIRAIREGISRDGRPLAPLMPYGAYKSFSDEDTKALVAYLRTLAPSDKVSPVSELPPPLKIAMKFMPAPVEEPVAHPAATDTVAYGRYLTSVAACGDCHGKDFSGGGIEFHTPVGPVLGANITPDPETGIGAMTREGFINLFKAYKDLDPALKMNAQTASHMPWSLYAGMKEEDLGAIFDYLRTVPAVRKQVVIRPQARAEAAH
ncbi:cytochrome c [Archangium sp.]|jgi:mono/diheme cytochrome c family protein|uniref:cytochrome c n=1 Tax=Archangium sp. TaxID=1872627 RepID=UPI002ED8819A